MNRYVWELTILNNRLIVLCGHFFLCPNGDRLKQVGLYLIILSPTNN